MNVAELSETCGQEWPETKAFLRKMVEINSFTANVAGVRRVAEVAAEQFEKLGFQARHVPHEREDIGAHLVLKRPHLPNATTIALISHLDTVFPEEEERRNNFGWREEGDRIYGPGTNDIKGGIALSYLVLAALKRVDAASFENTNWVVLCNACEEVDSDDFGALCRRELPADTLACLLFEADGGEEGDDFSLVTARNGRATFRVEVQGRGAHAGGQHARGVNAIAQVARIVSDLESLTNYETGPTVNVGRIEGGTVLNRVPERASAELEMRAFSVEVFEKAKQHILAWMGTEDLRSRDEEAEPCLIAVETLDQTAPWPKNAASEQLLAVWQEAGREFGCAVETERRGGLSDGNVLWDAFPTLDGLGPKGDFCHCSEDDPEHGKFQEYADAASFVPKAALNLRAILRLLGQS